MLRFAYATLLAASLLYNSPSKADASRMADDIHAWDVFELEMRAKRELSSPYVESLPEGGPGLVSVTFQGENGEAEGRQFKVTGFWDGGSRWRVRFAPPAPGDWSYRSSSSDSGLDGQMDMPRSTIPCRISGRPASMCVTMS